ncbi:hypothetical protein K469DRAFT_387111 [Zopfia rhizophila CBS 207.26]|uniref:Uncharacterized protein n=1 Tax=Zopfia rhizophila CBS 207.26 TaxID=1314779 RepID=A0A6A6EIR1_9PEZI|nr:hypothetical protein K469DRAFT_387111 [Zopfia rhizophila CBS 207.26]
MYPHKSIINAPLTAPPRNRVQKTSTSALIAVSPIKITKTGEYCRQQRFEVFENHNIETLPENASQPRDEWMMILKSARERSKTVSKKEDDGKTISSQPRSSTKRQTMMKVLKSLRKRFCAETTQTSPWEAYVQSLSKECVLVSY